MSTISASTTSTTAFKITTDTTGALVFQTGASPTTAVTFDASQNVGVGTTSPTTKLQVVGTGRFSSGTEGLAVFHNGSVGYIETSGGSTTPIGFANGGVERARIDTSGNFGLGVTPSAWSGFTALQVGNTAIWTTSTNNTHLSSNLYYNGSARIYIGSNYATEYAQQNGEHKWFYAASGTAGGTISFTQAMTLNTSGNLGVGVTSIASDAKVHVGGALRAGSTTYNASPASTLFSNTLAAASGSTRVVNFDGNGSDPSVWWTTGTRAYGAIDASATNNLAFWANNGTTWQQQFNVNYGNVQFLTTVNTSAAVNATGGVMTVTNPSGSFYNENMRLPRASGTYASICMATDPAASSGAIDGQFTFLVYPTATSNGQFAIRHSTGADALTIQKTGYISTPLNPAFEAKGDSAAVLSTIGWQKVPYSQSVTQRGTAYSSGSSRFTAPIAGWYQFNAQWSAAANADDDGTFTFAINGSQNGNKGTVSMPNTAGSYEGHTMAATMYLAANDYVEVFRYSTVSTTTRTNDWQGWFSGHFIG